MNICELQTITTKSKSNIIKEGKKKKKKKMMYKLRKKRKKKFIKRCWVKHTRHEYTPPSET